MVIIGSTKSTGSGEETVEDELATVLINREQCTICQVGRINNEITT